jgi:MOSC domain-containing protein YiiM
VRFDGSEPETCQRCGFDSRRWQRQDASAIFKLLGCWWRLATAEVSANDLNRRPAPGVWSALEYGLHSAFVLPILRYELEVILDHDRADVHDPCPEIDIEDATRPLTLDPESILDDLEREGASLSRLVDSCQDGWGHLGLMDDRTWWQADATLRHVVHDTTHHFLDVGEGLVHIGAALPTAESRVDSVNISDRGVPKLPVKSISVQLGGIERDRQAQRKHHGPPFQAVCLWSSDVIADLASQGHAIGPGAAGENLTLSGADWPRLRPGTRVLAGTALLELSYPSDPCQDQARRFREGEISRLSHANHPHRARWYAWVRRPGQVQRGDLAVISPP